MQIFKQGWCVIYTKPKHEKKVSNRLTEIGIPNLFPTSKVLRTWHDRKKQIDSPLFPSYIFLYLTDMEMYYAALNTEGSLYYVRSGKEVARVREDTITNVKLLAAHLQELEISYDRFQPGEQLVIKEGPLTGLNCEIVDCSKTKKILVRVNLLQRNILTYCPPDFLMPAEPNGSQPTKALRCPK
jgi:transcription antitermination factor NusG